MEPNWAADHLQVIRTLMERAAIYRRALAPVMMFTGAVGIIAALAGGWFRIDSVSGFIAYWLGVAFVTMAGAFLLVRRQALKDAEPFWSTPFRRVIQALLPPLTAGVVVSVVFLLHRGSLELRIANVVGMLWLPLLWVVLYGCALHAAGFFMPRGMKVFGWAFIIGGCGLFALGVPDVSRPLFAYGLMGFFFGALHLAYGVYLYFTEKTKNAA